MVECLKSLCALGRAQLSKYVGNNMRITEAVGKPVVQVASLIDNHGRLSSEGMSVI